jgi:hypothetical protein
MCKDPQNCKTTTSKIISNRSVKDTLYALLRIGPFSCHNYFNPLCYGDTTYACESFNGFVLQFIPKMNLIYQLFLTFHTTKTLKIFHTLFVDVVEMSIIQAKL